MVGHYIRILNIGMSLHTNSLFWEVMVSDVYIQGCHVILIHHVRMQSSKDSIGSDRYKVPFLMGRPLTILYIGRQFHINHLYVEATT